MRKLFYMLMIMGMLTLGSSAFAEEIPTLFNLKWGSSIEECHKNGMKSKTGEKVELTGDLAFMDIGNARRKIGNIEINSVGYFFNENELSSIVCIIDTYANFEILKKRSIKRYGEPMSEATTLDKYGKKNYILIMQLVEMVYIHIEFNFSKGMGLLSYASIEHSKSAIEKMKKRPRFKTNYL